MRALSTAHLERGRWLRRLRRAATRLEALVREGAVDGTADDDDSGKTPCTKRRVRAYPTAISTDSAPTARSRGAITLWREIVR